MSQSVNTTKRNRNFTEEEKAAGSISSRGYYIKEPIIFLGKFSGMVAKKMKAQGWHIAEEINRINRKGDRTDIEL
jgi:hypothetical protein